MIGAGLVVVAGLVYFFFFSTAETDTVVSSTPASDAELTFVNLASQLGTLEFDTSLLSDPRFMALVDVRTAIIPEASGRKDPFAPISGVPTTRNP